MSTSTRNILRKTCHFNIMADKDSWKEDALPKQTPRERKWLTKNNKQTGHVGNHHTFGGANRTVTSAPHHGGRLSMESTILDDLNDSKSELARFLFVKTNTHEKDGSWLKSMRNLGATLTSGDDDDEDREGKEQYKSLNHQHGWFYNLALEPMEIRSERIIMMAEQYALFG